MHKNRGEERCYVCVWGGGGGWGVGGGRWELNRRLLSGHVHDCNITMGIVALWWVLSEV